MALADEVQSRYSTARLTQLTNPGVETATTVNTTKLAEAIQDVESDFPVEAGVAYDNSDDRHIRVAVMGVIATLYTWGESPGGKAQSEFDAYIDRLQALAKVTGRDRLTPKTKSVLEPSTETTDTRPDFDREHFDRTVPNPPR